MKRFKNILVINNDQESGSSVLDRAVALARHNGARLTVMEAIEEIKGHILTSVFRASDEQLNIQYAEQRHQQLVQTMASRIDNDLDVNIQVQVGTPFIDIIQAVMRGKHDLVMMTETPPEGLRQHLFSSTALHLMRKCPCPVWVMKPMPRPNFQGILAAVDPDPEDPTKQALNEKIMDLSSSLAQQEQSKLHVAHVWAPWRGPYFRGMELTPEQNKQLRKELQMQRRQALDELTYPYQLQKRDSKTHFLVGEPAEAIGALAEKYSIELIVMGTVCRTGLPGLLIGNTAESVLGQVGCSVLAVKPEGFVSPIPAQA